MDGRDRMSQMWTEYKDGKPSKRVEIAFKRVQQ
jgi:hypothetical protein